MAYSLGPLTDVVDITLEKLARAFDELFECVPKPTRVEGRNGFSFRYTEKTVQQAIILKLARLISGLHAAKSLLELGFLQEVGAIQRIIDEIDADILFLSGSILFGKMEARHEDYLKEFFAEEFDIPDDPLASSQKRHHVPREKIRAYNARMYQSNLPVSKVVAVTETIEKAYSGYVHASAVHTFDMYGGSPLKFHIAGIPSKLRRDQSSADLLNYYHRSICCTYFAAKALRNEQLSNDLYKFSQLFAVSTGIDQWDDLIPAR